MIREIVKTKSSMHIINLPEEMIGKTVEVIAFEVPDENQRNAAKTLAHETIKTLQDIKRRYSQYPVISHNGYQFDRNEANDYE